MNDPVLLDVSDGVATITLNRPDAMNSLDVATKEALLDAVRSVADDPAARCVVLTGTGRAFCVGQDLKQHIEILQSGSPDQLFRTVDEHYNPIVTSLAGMAKPVIAAVNGVAAGAGASLAFACDLRIVADTAGFNLAFAGVALSCDTGSSFTLQRLVGPAKAIELLYQPRTIKADEALALGLATRVVPAADLAAEVGVLAATLAAGPTVAYGAMRRSVAFAAGHTFEESVAFESSMMTLTGATADHAAAVHAFVNKEKPVFEGRADSLGCLSGYHVEHVRTSPGAEDAEDLAGGDLRHQVPGRAPAVLDGEGEARVAVVVPAGHGAVADAAAVEGGRRQAEQPGHPAREPRPLDRDVDAVQRLVERQHVVRPDPRQELHHRPRLRLGGGLRAGVVRAGQRRPVVRVVAVEVDAVGVAAGPVRQAVGVVRRHHPQVDAVHRLAVAQRAQDRGRRRLVAVHPGDQHDLRLLRLTQVPGHDRAALDGLPDDDRGVRRLDRLRLGRGRLRTREHGGREGDRQRET